MEIAVFGATGGMGGMVVRALREAGAPVRALTRDPDGPAAQALAADGVHVVGADAADSASLTSALAGVKSAFVMVPAFAKGRYSAEAEITLGRSLAAAVGAAGVEHVVYGAGGVGRRVGLPHFDAKVDIEEALRAHVKRVHALFPTPFMELQTDARFYPHLSTWSAEPRVIGWDTPLPWVATRDIGRAAATLLLEPQRDVPEQITLSADVKTLREARSIYTRVAGRPPRSRFVPLFVLKLAAGAELPAMWKFARDEPGVGRDHTPLRELAPDPWTLEDFLHDKLAHGRAEVR